MIGYPGSATRRSNPRPIEKPDLLLVTVGPQPELGHRFCAEPGCEHRNWTTIYLQEPRPFNHPFLHRRTTGVLHSAWSMARVNRHPIRVEKARSTMKLE